MAYFDAKKLPPGKKEYIASIDIMGIKNHMMQSVCKTANFVFKFHSLVVSVYRQRSFQNVFVYPVMDGVYITANDKSSLANILVRIYRELVNDLLQQADYNYWYLVRGSVAYGKIIHGHDIPYEASKAFLLELGYKNLLLLGQPLIDAHKGESEASPMGIKITDSAKKSNSHSTGTFSLDWKWYESDVLSVKTSIVSDFKKRICGYYDWLQDNGMSSYSADRRSEHLTRIKDYFQID